MVELNVAFAFLLACTIGAIVSLQLCPIAKGLGLEDIPNERKKHGRPTPVVGGIGVVFAFYLVIVVFGFGRIEHPAFWVGSVFIFMVGVLDDMREFGSRHKLIAQSAAALLMIMWGGIQLTSLGNLLGFGEVLLGNASVFMTVFGFLGVVNSINMIDGVDGLSGTLCSISTVALAFLALYFGQLEDAVILLTLSGAILGFLLLNFRFPGRPAALVFLGDAGALFIGFVIAWFSIKLSQPTTGKIAPAIILWTLAIPLFDTVSVMIRRLLRKKNPFRADRTHIHHLLLELGVNEMNVVLLLALFSLICAGIAVFNVLWWKLADSLMFGAFMLLFAAYFLLTNFLYFRTIER